MDKYSNMITRFIEYRPPRNIENKGNAYMASRDFNQALANFLGSLKISEEGGFKKGIAYASLNIGVIFASGIYKNDSLGLPYYHL